MIIPEYWAEAKTRKIINGKTVTLKRFGWSDNSASEAQHNAEQRVDEALVRLTAGEKIRRVDHKVPYNGAEGLPIREEIISKHNDVIITRNSYGALCLNTPDVLFADIDYISTPGYGVYILSTLSLLLASTGVALYFNSWATFLGLVFLTLILTSTVAQFIFNIINTSKGGVDNIALQPIKNFSQQYPDWHLRIYRTPLGYRILTMHQTFDPGGEDTHDFFKATSTDPLYMKMCKNQQCFRARLTPKPWRIGMTHITPRPGVWPINPTRLPARLKWIQEYDRISRDYAACSFMTRLGSKTIDAKAAAIQKLHDDYCQSDKGLPIA